MHFILWNVPKFFSEFVFDALDITCLLQKTFSSYNFQALPTFYIYYSNELLLDNISKSLWQKNKDDTRCLWDVLQTTAKLLKSRKPFIYLIFWIPIYIENKLTKKSSNSTSRESLRGLQGMLKYMLCLSY